MGDSVASDPSNQVTPAGVPDRPAQPTAARGDHQATVSWTMPSGNGSPVTGYTITSNPGWSTKTVPGEQTSATVTGLTNGTAYTFTVMATNAKGDGFASPPSAAVVPAGAPHRVATPTVTIKGRSVTIKWKPAYNNGSPVTGYRITISNGKTKTLGPDARKVVFKRLKPGLYKFQVTATNDIGKQCGQEVESSHLSTSLALSSREQWITPCGVRIAGVGELGQTRDDAARCPTG